jgi:hypothetical protein
MSDAFTDAARQTERALEYVRREAEREMSEQPQKEYIITDTDFKQIYEIEYHLTCEERRAICERSRLHTPAPAPDTPDKITLSLVEFELYIKDKKAEAAKAAREQFAATIDELLKIDEPDRLYAVLDNVRQSLRSQQEPQQEGRR